MLGLVGDMKMVACIPGGGAVAERESACCIVIKSGVIVIAGSYRWNPSWVPLLLEKRVID
jgi:hypothetical protein